MRIEVIDNHSVAVDLLKGGPVLDAGCRGFRFALHFCRKHVVICLDPDELIPPSDAANIFYARAALHTHAGLAALIRTDDPEAQYIVSHGQHYDKPVKAVVGCTTMKNLGHQNWDLVKLNIEGSEIGVLESWPGPIANQIVVSFHLHTGRQTEADIDRAIEHISQWYAPVQHKKDARYCAGENYWDSLFILRGLL